jgi:XTP/dITP diphosphohydrolase
LDITIKVTTILFASSNKNKIAEISALLPDTINVAGLKDAGIDFEIPETGNTISENSAIKASFVRQRLKELNKELPVFADDSGLEVTALNNAPGVYSARYAGEPKNDANNNKKLLQALHNVNSRHARFVTVITLIINEQEYSFEGQIKGTIAFEPRGNSGFGYDPLFIPQGYRSTFAELGAEVKNSISHRALAVKKLVDFLKNY